MKVNLTTTPAQRKEFYKRLVHYLSRPNTSGGYCLYIYSAAPKSYKKLLSDFDKYNLRALPELMKYKPKNYYTYPEGHKSSFWWNPKCMKKRIQVLNRIIATMD